MFCFLSMFEKHNWQNVASYDRFQLLHSYKVIWFYLSPHSSALYLHKVNIAAMAPHNLNQ